MPCQARKRCVRMVLSATLCMLVWSPVWAATAPPSTYVVQKGDTLYAIAKKYGLTIDEIVNLNKLSNANVIKPGMKLTLSQSPPTEENPVKNAISGKDGKLAATQAQTYTVQSGDSVWAVSKKTGVSVADILQFNSLRDDTILRVGMVLRLTPAQKVPENAANSAAPTKGTTTNNHKPAQVPVPTLPQPRVLTTVGGLAVTLPLLDATSQQTGKSEQVSDSAEKKTAEPDPKWSVSLRQNTGITEADIDPETATQGSEKFLSAPSELGTTIPQVVSSDAERAREAIGRLKGGLSEGNLAWPATARITSKFGRRWGKMHEGIDFGVPTGTPVRVAADGVVSFSGWMNGYGNLVIVNHGESWETYYGHNSELRVRVGDIVRTGQVIARSGATGNVTGPNIHFEVRHNGEPLDPTRYLK